MNLATPTHIFKFYVFITWLIYIILQSGFIDSKANKNNSIIHTINVYIFMIKFY